MFEPLGKLLPKSLKNAGAARKVEAAVMVRKASDVLRDVFGAEMASTMHAAVYRDGELTIICDRSVYGKEVELREQDVIEKMNKALGSRVVSRVRARS